MKYNKTKILYYISSIYILVLLAGCVSWTNPTPDPIHASVITYDETGNQTASVLCVYSKKFIITQQSVDTYNALIKVYGKTFVPELKRNYGIQPITEEELTFTNEILKSKYGDNSAYKNVKLYSITPLALTKYDALVTKNNSQMTKKQINKDKK